MSIPDTESSEMSDVPPPKRRSSSEWRNDDDTKTPDEPESDGPSWAGSGSSGPTGGIDCDRAADCCLKLTQISGAPSLMNTCNNFRTAPTSACAQLLTTFRQVVSQQGMSCP